MDFPDKVISCSNGRWLAFEDLVLVLLSKFKTGCSPVGYRLRRHEK
jgi:hypothetical protein